MPVVHTHVSALHIGTVFLGVVALGGVWRLGAAHLAAMQQPIAAATGRAMLFQY